MLMYGTEQKKNVLKFCDSGLNFDEGDFETTCGNQLNECLKSLTERCL